MYYHKNIIFSLENINQTIDSNNDNYYQALPMKSLPPASKPQFNFENVSFEYIQKVLEENSKTNEKDLEITNKSIVDVNKLIKFSFKNKAFSYKRKTQTQKNSFAHLMRRSTK